MLAKCFAEVSKKSLSSTLYVVTRGLRDEIKVSESDPVSSEDITLLLDSHKLSYQTGHACIRTTCPRFTRPKLKLDKLDQLYINSTTGMEG